MLDQGRLAALRARLEERRAALLAAVAAERGNEAPLDDRVGTVRDAGDESVGIEETDLRNALRGRDAAEMREVDAALARMDAGEYGLCPDCGREIDPARLEANPTALRCVRDQEIFERRTGTGGAPL
jgi:RNA polymerase-binding transcription factor DksA